MNNNNGLTVDVVEDVQRAVENKQDVSGFVSSLQWATLPGLVEYRCLQSNGSGIPNLPEIIGESEIGIALQEVSCHLANGKPQRRNPRNNEIKPRTAEFFSIAMQDEVGEEAFELFKVRFQQSASKAGFSLETARGIASSLHEMAENALIHSESQFATLVGYHVTDKFAQFTVADLGRGVLASLKTNPRFANLEFSSDALQTALRDRTSRFEGGGFGFRQVFKSLTNLWGTLRFRSGAGCITMDGTGLNHDVGTASYPPTLPGFQVTVTCRPEYESADPTAV